MATLWQPYTGPNNWYRLNHPPSWKAETLDSAVSLVGPEGRGVLTLTSFWLAETTVRRGAAEFVDLNRLFPTRRKVRPLRPLAVGDESAGFEGEALFGKDAVWWRRLFRKPTWRRWRVWCVRQGPVHILALYLQTGEADSEGETIAGMVLGSIEFSPAPAEPPESFAERVLDLARRKFPLLKCEPEADFQLRLGESKISLFNFYRSYLNAPDQFESIVLPALTTVVQVQEWGDDQMRPPLEAIRERIMPMLYPIEVWRERFPQFVGVPWVGGLAVLYVVDEKQAYWYIRDDLRQMWNVSDDDLHELALENLDRYFRDRPMEFTMAGTEEGPRLLVPARPDTYNSARVLSPAFHGKLREVLGGQCAVGLPSRDFLVAINLDSAEAVEQVRMKVEEDYKQMDHPLTDKLLLVTHDGVTEYAPWV